MTPNVDINSLLLFFSTHHIDINESWLKDVVNYLNSQIVNINFDQYKNLIFHQLIFSNLCESLTIKKNFSWNCGKNFHREKINLFVQIKNIYDISRSALHQYLEMSFQNCISIGDFDLQNNNLETNSNKKETNSLPKRMLMLNITDGKNDFIAIESEYIPFLSEYFRPGIKMYIFGECQIVNGIIYLTQKNCQVFGGEVDTYLSQNTLDMVLLRLLPKINLPNKEKKQARTFCIEKMKIVDGIFNNNSTNNLQKSRKEEIDENVFFNKENTNDSLPKVANSSDDFSSNRPKENNVSTNLMKSRESNTGLSLVNQNVKNESTTKKANLTIPEIFDYFFKLHIFLSDNWISNIIQTVNNGYLDKKSQIRHIYKLFLESNINQCLIGSSSEFQKGYQKIENKLLMEIDSICLVKTNNIKIEKDVLQNKFFYKLSDGNQSFNAFIKEPIVCSNMCNCSHLMPGLKLFIHGDLEVDNQTFSLPDIDINPNKITSNTTINKHQYSIVIDSDEEYIIEDNIPSKKQKIC